MKKILIIILTTTYLLPNNTSNAVTSCILPRSYNAHREHLAAQTLHTINQNIFTDNFDILFEYKKSFRQRHIMQCLFGDTAISQKGCKGGVIKIQGSSVTDRDERAWLADYLYLPTDYESRLLIEPSIRSINTHLKWHTDLSFFYNGMYARIYAPLVHTRWNLNICEQKINTGTADHPADYFTTNELPRENLLPHFIGYGCGKAPNISNDQYIFESLNFARIKPNSQHTTQFAEIRAELGCNIISHDRYHLGINILTATPTGSKKESNLLFEPIVGNGHHWELGAGIHGHARIWKDYTTDRIVQLYGDAQFTHLFTAHQKRTFDLKDQPLSRYALAVQDSHHYAPVANITTLDINVSIPLQKEITLMLNLTEKDWSFNFGYNFWAQSCETIKCKQHKNNKRIQELHNTWALKGDGRMYGYKKTTNIQAILSSVQSSFISLQDLNIQRQKSHSHTIFSHIRHTWNKDSYHAHWGVGGSAELGNNNPCKPSIDSTNCLDCSISFWNFWISGGINY